MLQTNRCLNCRQVLAGRFCSACGQDTKQNKKALAAFGYDFVEGSLQYDSKIWRTLFPFIVRPGYLTKEFNAGRRVRYLHPRKMYFFVSIVFFLLYAFFDDARFYDLSREKRDLLKTAAEMAQTAGGMSDDIESGIQSATGQKVTLRTRIVQRLAYLKHMDRELLQERFTRTVASNVPKVLFLLLPVFALITMLFFRKPKRYYVEHLVFAFHAHTYVFAIAALCVVYAHVSGDRRHAAYGLLVSLAYVFLSMRVVYDNGWRLSALKCVAVLTVYACVVAVALTALVATTFWFI